MKKIFFLLLQFSMIYSLNAQTPFVKQWDRSFGGSLDNDFGCFSTTKDGGYILGGSSKSPISGDKTQTNRDSSLRTGDYWIIKIDGNGNKEWDKRFGGISFDDMFALQQTVDGGYILGGISYSPAGEDKSQANWGDADYWIVKTDSLGNKEWDRRYGWTNDDLFVTLQQTIDGGYILGGTSGSAIGGDVSMQSRGGDDYWVIKIDATGNKQWDKKFGTDNQDILGAVIQTTDGGYLIGGSTGGDSIADKTGHLKGFTDYWIIKTDSIGTKLWDKDYGGIYGNSWLIALIQTRDNGYLLAGSSTADSGGDKTQNKKGFWIVKTDSSGNKLWDKAFTNGYLATASMTSDGGFLLGGESSSNITVDKSEHNFGKTQSWIVKTDSLGNRQWDKTIFTNDSLLFDGNGFIGGYGIEISRGSYAICANTNAGIGGYKSEPLKGIADYFIIKMTDTLLSGIQDLCAELRFSVYPNPATNEVAINLQRDNLRSASFALTDFSGQLIYQSLETDLASNYTKILSLATMTCGIYLLEVNVDGERLVKKILKE